MPADAITILDGGMGRELLRIGAPFQQPEWSALALLEGPEYVRRVHDSYIAAGADVLTTNSYAVVPFHIGELRFRARGRQLADLAGRLGREAVAASPRPGIRLAGSLPPVFGSYRPDLFRPEDAAEILDPLVAGLAPHVDFWLAETQGSIAEARAARIAASAASPRPFWVSFTLEDGDYAGIAAGRVPPTIRSGEAVAEAARAAIELGAAALLFNCAHASVVEAAVREAGRVFADVVDAPKIGAYANAFDPESDDAPAANEGLSGLRRDLDPEVYSAFATRWREAGATIIGGCCGIGPEYIATLSRALRATA